jgi:hypothetical protein
LNGSGRSGKPDITISDPKIILSIISTDEEADGTNGFKLGRYGTPSFSICKCRDLKRPK